VTTFNTETYEDVTKLLPDEAVGSDKLDMILTEIDKLGIEIVNAEPEDKTPVASATTAATNRDFSQTLGKAPRPSDDPIRMYLSQMSVIPLLNRDEEVSLAKKIEVARKRYRRSVLSCNYALSATIEILQGFVDRKLDQRTSVGTNASPLSYHR